jgi:hypothetical protein
MSIDKRVRKNQNTILNLKNLLIEICKSPSNENFRDYKSNLKSQGGLSKIENEEIGIYKSSINTLKRISPYVLSGGFEELDKLRIMAYDSICSFEQSSENSNKINKTGLNKRVAELEEEVLALQKAHLLSINALVENLNTFNIISKSQSLDMVKRLSNNYCSPIKYRLLQKI